MDTWDAELSRHAQPPLRSARGPSRAVANHSLLQPMRRVVSLERHGSATSGPAQVHSLTHVSVAYRPVLWDFTSHWPASPGAVAQPPATPPASLPGDRRPPTRVRRTVSLHASQRQTFPAEVPWCVRKILPLGVGIWGGLSVAAPTPPACHSIWFTVCSGLGPFPPSAPLGTPGLTGAPLRHRHVFEHEQPP